MTSVIDFQGATDSERIEAAIRACTDGVLLIPRRISDIEPERDWWLLDRAILVPGDMTVILQECRLKLSDHCRDNFFRSANCGYGLGDPKPLRNIHLLGQGTCTLEGADHPRATGDSSKRILCPCPKNHSFSGSPTPTWSDLHDFSYGTDAGKEGESQRGDWRNIGILMANVDNLTISGLRIVEAHAWGISLEACSNAHIDHIFFQACMTRTIDGQRHNVENQDGINLRNGCHHVVISDISGTTGDDTIALTCIVPAPDMPLRTGGAYDSTHVMHGDFSRRDKDIHDVIIRNVQGYSASGICCQIRLLPTNSARIWNVLIDGVVDGAPDSLHARTSVLLGEGGNGYGQNLADAMSHITISNVISNCRSAILVPGYLSDSIISNVISRNPEGKVIDAAPGHLRNVILSNIATQS